MNSDVEFHIRNNYSWARLPANVKQQLGNSQLDYEKYIKSFSIRNQLRHKNNLVRTVFKDDKRYYEALLRYSREHLMLFPYHLSDVIVKGMRVTPFQYYLNIMQDLMAQEKSYDSLPNFTAADCLRLLGIGRNQYIDLMNQNRSSKKFFSRRKPAKYVLPTQPVAELVVEPWWEIHVGYITEDDIKMVNDGEKVLIDTVIDHGPQKTGNCSFKDVHSLYRKGLVYLLVPIMDEDCIIVPPLEGFVMNRVLGDYLETLLYKIFVSIDEHTSVSELANILQIDLDLVKNAVSLYCRLGFAYRKGQDFDASSCHSTWSQYKKPSPKRQCDSEGALLINWGSVEKISMDNEMSISSQKSPDSSCAEDTETTSLFVGPGFSKRIAFLFDSSLTAFLMMGNLSPGLKSHAVTMFEVGKLPDESLDSLLAELDKIGETGEGEAQRYYDHALTLQSTVKFLRNNPELRVLSASDSTGTSVNPMGLDLIRCESLLSLEPATCARLLNKNYALLVSMAPLSNEIRPITSCLPPHLGPSIPEVSSIWFKLFLYHITNHGPPSLLLAKGTRMRKLPQVFKNYDRLLVTTWGHDPGIAPTSNALLTLNDALSHSAVLVQAYGCKRDGETVYVPFPFDAKENVDQSGIHRHPVIEKLKSRIDLQHSCGYITMINISKSWSAADLKLPNKIADSSDGNPVCADVTDGLIGPDAADLLAAEIDAIKISETKLDSSNDFTELDNWTLLDCYFGLPLFDLKLNKDICQRVSQNGLCRSESLSRSTHSSRLLTIHLLDFIFDVQGTTPETETRFDLSSSSRKSSDMLNIPAPSKNLLFTDGKFQIWDER
ncbi:hypothetical protein CHUAL_005185 [Chamberlinius hualienensis]